MKVQGQSILMAHLLQSTRATLLNTLEIVSFQEAEKKANNLDYDYRVQVKLGIKIHESALYPLSSNFMCATFLNVIFGETLFPMRHCLCENLLWLHFPSST